MKYIGCSICNYIILVDTEDWYNPMCCICWEYFGMPEQEPAKELVEIIKKNILFLSIARKDDD